MDNYIEYYLEWMKNTCLGIKDEYLLDFTQAIYSKSYSGKTEIFGINSFHCNIGFVVKGIVKAYYITSKGEEKTVNFIRKNEYVTDYAAFLSGSQSKYIFKTLTPTVIVFLPKAAINELYEKHAVFQKFGRLIAESIIQELKEQMEDLLFLSAKVRYQKFLKKNADLVNKISVGDIASLIGVERQSLTRIRKQLISKK